MSLRGRLWLVLGLLFLAPLLVGALVLLLVVPDARSQQSTGSVDRAAVAVRSGLVDQCRALGLAARAGLLESVVSSPQVAVDNLRSGGYVDFAAILDRNGAPVATSGAALPGAGPPASLPRCSVKGSGSGDAFLSEQTSTGTTGDSQVAVVGRRVDAGMLDNVRELTAAGGEVLLLDGNRVVYSTLDAALTATLATATRGEPGTMTVGSWTVRVDPPMAGVPWTTVVARDQSGGVPRTGLFALILLIAAIAAGTLVAVVARGLSRPYTEITEAAERVARGELDTSITPAAEGEAGRLGSAVSQMTVELRRNMTDLERSREDLRNSLERIGDTLSSTHDLDGLLQVVLETAMVTLQARSGVVLHMSADRLELIGEHGLHEAGLRAPSGLAPGIGVLGRVVSTGASVRGPLGSGSPELEPATSEPDHGFVLAVPLRSMGAVVGVLALYDRIDGQTYDAADEGALRTLAGQTAIALDNVHLHNEAQRLSTTDPLTGLWNFRYLSMSLAREIERSTRFDRPLAVLMLDLDHFKSVNDRYGHARGDSVLRELGNRVQEQIREVDTFARYGGEEFVVVLPETDVEGAEQLAERICDAIRSEPFRTEGEPDLMVTVSIGGAAFPDNGNTPALLMRAADLALYAAKGAGRDRWRLAEPTVATS